MHRSVSRLLVAVLLSAGAALPVLAADTRVGVSVSISQPGFYGRVDVGDTPPAVIYPQPVVVLPGPVTVHQRPIYMRVPPGHEKKWTKYCARYRACGQPVLFVRHAEVHRHEDGRGRDAEGYGRDEHRHDEHGRHGHPHKNGARGKGHGRGH